jgi:hypothetical protein
MALAWPDQAGQFICAKPNIGMYKTFSVLFNRQCAEAPKTSAELSLT